MQIKTPLIVKKFLTGPLPLIYTRRFAQKTLGRIAREEVGHIITNWTHRNTGNTKPSAWMRAAGSALVVSPTTQRFIKF